MRRNQREAELKGMLASHAGRNQLTQLLRQHLNMPAGQLPLGTPFIQTILDHEFKDEPIQEITAEPTSLSA
jgi:hypothetical protein